MADSPQKPMTRAEYDAQIMQASLEALARSRELLRTIDAQLPPKRLQSGELPPDLEPEQERERQAGRR